MLRADSRGASPLFRGYYETGAADRDSRRTSVRNLRAFQRCDPVEGEQLRNGQYRGMVSLHQAGRALLDDRIGNGDRGDYFRGTESGRGKNGPGKEIHVGMHGDDGGNGRADQHFLLCICRFLFRYFCGRCGSDLAGGIPASLPDQILCDLCCGGDPFGDAAGT